MALKNHETENLNTDNFLIIVFFVIIVVLVCCWLYRKPIKKVIRNFVKKSKLFISSIITSKKINDLDRPEIPSEKELKEALEITKLLDEIYKMEE